ncbi:MAG TPA: DMT family transporter [Desulfobacteria bacterium]|nr:DMT family transporter [Desulfobacteria bacterium]
MNSDNNVFKNMFTNKIWVFLIATLCAVLWGSAFPVLKISYEELKIPADDFNSKLVLAGMRFFLAAVLLIALVLFEKRSVKVGKKYVPELVISGLLQITLQYFFFYNGLGKTSGMKGAIINSSSVFFVFILAHLFYKDDKLTWKKVFGLTFGFAGIILVNYGKSFTPDFTLRGEGYLVLAAVFSAFGTIVSKRLSVHLDTKLMTAWQMLLGSLLLVLCGLPALTNNTMNFTTKAWGLLIYSAFLSAAAFSLWYSLLRLNKAGEISVYMFITPVSGAILSALLVPGEHLSVLMLGSLFLVAVGIISVNSQSRRRRQATKME